MFLGLQNLALVKFSPTPVASVVSATSEPTAHSTQIREALPGDIPGLAALYSDEAVADAVINIAVELGPRVPAAVGSAVPATADAQHPAAETTAMDTREQEFTTTAGSEVPAAAGKTAPESTTTEMDTDPAAAAVGSGATTNPVLDLAVLSRHRLRATCDIQQHAQPAAYGRQTQRT